MKKPTKKQITAELERTAKEHEERVEVLWRIALRHAAKQLNVEEEELEEEFGALT